MVEKIQGVPVTEQPEYLIAEIQAYDRLETYGYTPIDTNNKPGSVRVAKYEHPEFSDNPKKRGKATYLQFKNWQEAAEKLCK